MTQLLVPGFGYVDSSSIGQSFVPGQFLLDDTAPQVNRRAIIIATGDMAEIIDVQVGTGLKPLVLLGGEVRERSTTEGAPLVLVSGQLRTLASTETLII